MGAPIYQNAASYGYSGQGDLGVEKKSTAKSGTIEAVSAETKAKKAAEKKRLNTKTKDTEAKTVKQGRLSRKEAVKTAKNAAKSTRDAKLDKTNMDLEGAVGKRKEARATKRQEMQDIRNKERGARRADRADRRIKRIGDRNNMTVGDATKVYNDRQEALKGYAVGERGPNPTNIKKEQETKTTLEQQQLASETQRLKDLNDPPQEYSFNVDGIKPDSGSQKVVSGMDMLDGPTQQEASEDSNGIGTYMLDSKNRRGR